MNAPLLRPEADEPGAQLEVMEVAPFNGPLHVRINGTERVVGRDLASKIKVEQHDG